MFKHDAHGRLVFFPMGILGVGYIVTSPEDEARLRLFENRSWMWLLLAFTIAWLASKLFFGWGIKSWSYMAWSILAVLGVGSHFIERAYIKRMFRHLPVADERLTYIEARKIQLESAPTWARRLLSFARVFCGLIFGLAIIRFAQVGLPKEGAVQILLGFVLFGFLCFEPLYLQMHARRRKTIKPDTP
jgi:hypothetical protein